MMNNKDKMIEVLAKRKIIDGERSKLMAIRPIKYEFADERLKLMRANDWTEHEVDLSMDVSQYISGILNGGNLTAYKKALAFLSNLDGIQFNNLTYNIGAHITAPEIQLTLQRQAWEEGQHVLSYATMIETIGFDPIEVYWMFEQDGMLERKNEFITQSSFLLGRKYSPRNFLMAIVANIALEGIYFYNGFLMFYALERQNLMPGSANMIRLIQRDETNHLNFFIDLYHSFLLEWPEFREVEYTNDIVRFIESAVNLEAEWGEYIVKDSSVGLTPSLVRQFVQHLGDRRMTAMGLDTIWNVENPVPWFDDASSINKGKESFFETKVTKYQKAHSIEW